MAAIGFGNNVIQRDFARATVAVSTATLPFINDCLPETMLSDPLVNKLSSVDVMAQGSTYRGGR
jgi:hypothetical protein